MVVITEGFPSKREFITTYLDKKRQQIEIMSQRNFRTSSVPQKEEVITPADVYKADVEQNIKKSVKSGELETPQIIQLNDEPLFVKNFNEFIKKTNFHLDQLLSNSRKIDDDMNEIKKDVESVPAEEIESVPAEEVESQNSKDSFESDSSAYVVVSLSDVEEEILMQNQQDLKKANESRPSRDAIAIPKTGRSLRVGGGLNSDNTRFDMRESPKSRSEKPEKYLGKVSSSVRKPMSARTCKPLEKTNFGRPLSCEPRRTPRSSRTSFEKRNSPPLAKESSSNYLVPRSPAKGRVMSKIPVSIINLQLL